VNRTDLAAVWPPTDAVAKLAGHAPLRPTKAIRQKCLDCCGGQAIEVRLCEATNCALWPFRAGVHPYTKFRSQETDSEALVSEGTPTPENPPSSPSGLLRASGGRSGEGN
jgi:hypothetical protein